jgi:hypothetical protein
MMRALVASAAVAPLISAGSRPNSRRNIVWAMYISRTSAYGSLLMITFPGKILVVPPAKR